MLLKDSPVDCPYNYKRMLLKDGHVEANVLKKGKCYCYRALWKLNCPYSYIKRTLLKDGPVEVVLTKGKCYKYRACTSHTALTVKTGECYW